jgi:hypothetical protein
MQHLLHQDDTVLTHLCGAAIDCTIQLHTIAWLHTIDDSRVATPAAPVQPLSKVGCLRTHAHGNSIVVILLQLRDRHGRSGTGASSRCKVIYT